MRLPGVRVCLFGLLTLFQPIAAQSEPVTFRYESTTLVDGATTQVVVVFTFDTSLANGTGSIGISPTNGSYGPWSGTLTVGSETVSLTGGTIEVFNNLFEDAYDFRWDRARGTGTGTLLGEQLCFFRVLLGDPDANMFSSTDLPTDTTFASATHFIQDSYDITTGGTNCRSFGKSDSIDRRTFSLTVEGDTPAGSNVAINPSVILPNGTITSISMTFDSVESTGDTTVTASSQGPPPPSGFKFTNPPVYYEITTTSTFAGNVRVCLNWTESQIANDSNVEMFQYEGNQWVDITEPASRNTVNNRVCGTTTSFSAFTLMEVKYPFTGFFQPVDNLPTVNAVKAGAAVPVKFSLGGDLGLNILASGYPKAQLMQCVTGEAIDIVEETVGAGGNGLSYDAATGVYTYVWKTDKALATSCRELQLKFTDGEVYAARFTLRK